LRLEYEKHDCQTRVMETCVDGIIKERSRRLGIGLRLKSVMLAGKRGREMLAEGKKKRKETLKAIKKFLERLLYLEDAKIKRLEAVKVAREMGVEVAVRDLDYYIKTVPNPNEKRLKDLQYNLDEKKIALVDVQVGLYSRLSVRSC